MLKKLFDLVNDANVQSERRENKILQTISNHIDKEEAFRVDIEKSHYSLDGQASETQKRLKAISDATADQLKTMNELKEKTREFQLSLIGELLGKVKPDLIEITS